MSSILAKLGSLPLLGRQSTSPRWRRSILFTAILGTFMLVLMLTSKQVSWTCHGGLCDASNLREMLPKPEYHHASSDQRGNVADNVAVGNQSSTPASDFSLSGDGECHNFPDTSKVLILMKTGASEAYSKLPTHLLTMLKCLPNNFLLFSDMAENIAGHTVYDSLETVLSRVKETDRDFDIYHRQHRCPISHEECNEGHDVRSEGWNLDKFKNVHIAERAYRMRPDYDWYFFIDADTYVSFPTLMEWLPELDPNRLHYIGHEKHSGTFPFAHGGSGYLMSQAIMRHIFSGKTGVGNKYDEATQHNCCGDIMWSEIVLNETGLTPENMWPVISEFKPRTFNYYEEQWCQPLITLHHVNGEEINDLYAFEQGRKFAGRITIKDIYDHFVANHLQELRPDWDNGSQDVYYLDPEARTYTESDLQKAKTGNLSNQEREAHKSLTGCQEACQAQEACFQWKYRQGICGLAYNKTRLGKPVKGDGDEAQRSSSGWHMERINKWIHEQGSCNGTYEWRVMDKKESRDPRA